MFKKAGALRINSGSNAAISSFLNIFRERAASYSYGFVCLVRVLDLPATRQLA